MAALKGIASLKAAGALLGDEPRKESVEWESPEGEKFTFEVYIKPMSFGVSLLLQETNDRQSIANALAQLVMLEGEDGALEPLQYDVAMSLHPSFAWAIASVLNGTLTAKK